MVFAAASLLAAAGCSSSSSAGNTGSGGSTSGGKQVLRVFGYGFQTAPALGGAYPPQIYMTIDAQAAVKAINADPTSKVTLTYTFCDTKFTATGSESCAKQAVSSTGCDGSPCDVVFDITDLNDNLSVPAIAAAGIPIVGNPNTTQALQTPNVFCYTGTAIAEQQGLGYVLKLQKAHKVGLAVFQSPIAQADNSEAEQGIRAQGLSVGNTSIYPVTQLNPTPTVDTVLGGGADGLVFLGPGVGAAVKYVKGAFPNVKMALPAYELSPGVFTGLNSTTTNGIGTDDQTQPLSAKKVPGIALFDKEALSATPPQFQNFDFVLLTWLGVHFIANVANTISGPVTKASMMQALKTAKNINMYGLVPPWTSANRGTGGATACSPYNVDVAETLQNGIQIANNPGVFVNSLTGKVAYVDPGFTAPAR